MQNNCQWLTFLLFSINGFMKLVTAWFENFLVVGYITSWTHLLADIEWLLEHILVYVN